MLFKLCSWLLVRYAHLFKAKEVIKNTNSILTVEEKGRAIAIVRLRDCEHLRFPKLGKRRNYSQGEKGLSWFLKIMHVDNRK